MRQLTAFAVVFLNMRVVRPVFLPLLADANFADVQVAVCHPTVFVKSGEVFFLSAAALGTGSARTSGQGALGFSKRKDPGATTSLSLPLMGAPSSRAVSW